MDLNKILEHEIVAGINEGVRKRLSAGYNGPLDKIVDAAITKNADKIERVISDSVAEALVGDFSDRLRDAVAHKLGRVLISKTEGEIEKRANELRSSPVFRSKLTLAIENIVAELRVPKPEA